MQSKRELRQKCCWAQVYEAKVGLVQVTQYCTNPQSFLAQ